ncbi:hypothetical protein TB9_06045 [Xanthomonas perforans]|uniref:Uncharacterized protein n=1 Tax=Xanthomonas perforans TaxID=442694 RepID=A0AAQ0YL14_XANPE|nr:hypothetical protein BJD13_02030 [Xanthomonas perforans]AQS78218.1 hypothetical protein XPE_19900 [Xanthomonas perforans 91-118]AYO94994.1 hypothetical protein Xcom_08095 [Xanthomonas axonopodis pv. commiphoreae]OHX25671.1 hypothetical protein BHL63_12270 [Xanthomonas alfalfae]OQP39706.1 hypothetical protein IB62_009035 [Xanthomonas euvesicatoria]PPU89216.1 hypothetical protein XaclCFBP3371_07835 [Xanthomonas euvesicatoria pv. citrumelonis]
MRQDRTDDAARAAAWRNRLSAPKKKTARLESSAHLPTIEKPGHTVAAPSRHARVLRRRRRSTAGRGAPVTQRAGEASSRFQM